MSRFNRRSAPRVKHGRVQKKHNWKLSPDDYYEFAQALPVIDRKRPGRGYRHLLHKQDMVDFIELLPQWDELSEGLDAIVLAPREWADGWWEPGVVAVCAWDARLWTPARPDYCETNRRFLDRLGVPREDHGAYVLIKWTEATARAYQLLDVFLHELGHHHDHMTTKSRRDAARGEPYAERYAREHGDLIWDRYMEVFSLD